MRMVGLGEICLRARTYPILAVLLLLVSSGCVQAGSQGTGSASEGQPRAPKILTIAASHEPAEINGFSGGSTTGSCGTICSFVHGNLTRTLESGEQIPEMAAEVISTDKGNWRVNADGTMVTTWRLRADVIWHDGTPFTSEDLLFSWKVVKTPELTPPGGSLLVLDLMTSAAAPDPHTFVINWSAPYIGADRFTGGRILPKHLLEELFNQGLPNKFAADSYFRSDFVGLGPYRLTQWESGSFMEATRFDGYFKGKAPLDKVFLRFVIDPNARVANILAESVDVVLPPVSMSLATEIEQRWKGTGNRVIFEPSPNNRILEPQYRPELARPMAGLPNPLVRQALYQALDRQEFVEAATLGKAVIADSWVQPWSIYRPALESAIPRFPYDLKRAQELLTQAGWTRGSDGVLVHNQTAERFELTLRASQVGAAQINKDVELAIVADMWKQVGVEPVLDLQFQGVNSREYDGKMTGIGNVGNLSFENAMRRMHTSTIASDANRWGGQNLSGYSNQEVDRLIDRYNVTIPMNDRLMVERQLIQILFGQVTSMPLYWEILPTLVLKGVGSEVRDRSNDYFRWDRD